MIDERTVYVRDRQIAAGADRRIRPRGGGGGDRRPRAGGQSRVAREPGGRGRGRRPVARRVAGGASASPTREQARQRRLESMTRGVVARPWSSCASRRASALRAPARGAGKAARRRRRRALRRRPWPAVAAAARRRHGGAPRHGRRGVAGRRASAEGFAALDARAVRRRVCEQGRVQAIDTLVCEYRDADTLARGEDGAARTVGARRGPHRRRAGHQADVAGRVRSRAPRSERQGHQQGHRHLPRSCGWPLARRRRTKATTTHSSRRCAGVRPLPGARTGAGSPAPRRPRARRDRPRLRRRPPSSSSGPRRWSPGAPPTCRRRWSGSFGRANARSAARIDLHGRAVAEVSAGAGPLRHRGAHPRGARRPW